MRRLTPEKATSMPRWQDLTFGATNGPAKAAVTGCNSALNALLAPTAHPRVRAAVVEGAKPSDNLRSWPMATGQWQADVTEAVSPDRQCAAYGSRIGSARATCIAAFTSRCAETGAVRNRNNVMRNSCAEKPGPRTVK